MSISSKGYQTCALGVESTTEPKGSKAYCWGQGIAGIEDNDYEYANGSNAPIAVSMPDGVVFTKISSGDYFTYAIGTDSKTYCWGQKTCFAQLSELAGEIILGKDPQKTPLPIPMPNGISSYSSISAGVNHSCAIADNSKIYCWGKNYRGSLGIGSQGQIIGLDGSFNFKEIDTQKNTIDFDPLKIFQPQARDKNTLQFYTLNVDFNSIFVGINDSCAIDKNSKTYCWGDMLSGYDPFDANTPPHGFINPVVMTNVPAGVSFTTVAVGFGQACALGTDSKAYCWGWPKLLGAGEKFAETGRGYIPVPVLMPSGVSFTAISSGYNHTCALGTDSKAYCWGLGDKGQLGNGKSGENYIEYSPVAVEMTNVPKGVSFTSISSGYNHNCALGTDSKAYCWGDGGWEGIGNGSSKGSTIPVSIDMMAYNMSVEFSN